ncbi:hypothetical protein MRB53_007939 [Persea americana]|uniref:Uncharacterized protein n=1 Tax=Persea americana TaxID=3435 RepID=A0ACC2MLB0_PERAE|nr:hypothetical protein MRB53_007939 [Persea americana]
MSPSPSLLSSSPISLSRPPFLHRKSPSSPSPSLLPSSPLLPSLPASQVTHHPPLLRSFRHLLSPSLDCDFGIASSLHCTHQRYANR